MQWASIVYSIVYYILYPVFLIIKGILYVLHWLVTPIIYLGYFIRQIALIPWRFVAEFEVRLFVDIKKLLTVSFRQSGTSWAAPLSWESCQG